MRLLVACVVLGVSGASLPVLSQAAVTHYNLNIPRAPLDGALKEFARQTGLQVARFSDVTQGAGSAGPVAGSYTPEEALSTLLAGSGLSYRMIDARTIVIVRRQDGPANTARTDSTAQDVSGQSHSEPESKGDQKGSRSFWERFRLAQVDSGKAATDDPVNLNKSDAAPESARSPKALEEVVVTAQKRSERLQDVPVPVTSLSAESLISNSQVRLQDYFASVPGLDFTKGNRGETFLAIRGITAGPYANPTVGVVVDELPYGSSIANVGWGSVPDIDPNDLDHIEVLRGPQGTLYGASSMGGLIKYVTVDPDPSRVRGSVQAGMSSVRNAAEPGYNFHGALNLPVGSDAAVRVSGFGRQDPGYIDDPTLGLSGVNRANVEGGRLAALWRPSEAFSVKLSALLQQSKLDGSPDVTPGLADLQQLQLAETGWRKERNATYNATIKGRFAGVDLTSITGYSTNRILDSGDVSRFFTAMTQARFGVPGTSIIERGNTDKLSQELRLTLPLGDHVEWLVGGYYTHENSKLIQDIMANTVTGVFAGEWLNYNSPVTYSEYAGFTDLTYHLTDRASVQVGARESHDKQVVSGVDTGPLVGGLSVTPRATSDENAFTYLLTPQFKISPDLMVYARLASGYRPGGPNTAAAVGNGLPTAFEPDRTQNYEIGLKGAVLEHRLSFDTSVFYIDWTQIQLNLTNPSNGLAYNANGGHAKSQGIELSAEARPLTGLNVAASFAWTDAVLAETFPASSSVSGRSGDRLPYSPRISGNLSIEQSFPVTTEVTGFVAGTMTYVGDRWTELTADPTQRQRLPGYGRLDFRLGARGDDWTATAYVTNATDKRGLLAASVGVYPPYAYNPIQPRTLGLNVSRSF